MSVIVERKTVEDLVRERDELIRQLGGDEGAIRRLAAEYALTIEQDALFRELEGIDFLLGR